MTRSKPLIAFAIIQTAVFGLFLVQVFGDLSAAHDMLSFLTPEAREVLLADSTLLLLAIAAYLVATWLAFRDAGHGTKALKASQAANAKAWEFEHEYKAFKAHFDERMDELIKSTQEMNENYVKAKAALDAIEAQRQEAMGLLERSGKAHVELYMQTQLFNMKQDLVKLIDRLVNERATFFERRFAESMGSVLEHAERLIDEDRKRQSQSGTGPETPP
jgi:hypothetical protein